MCPPGQAPAEEEEEEQEEEEGQAAAAAAEAVRRLRRPPVRPPVPPSVPPSLPPPLRPGVLRVGSGDRFASERGRVPVGSFRSRPQVRRGDPLNLSILVSGGKETNQDSLSNGE